MNHRNPDRLTRDELLERIVDHFTKQLRSGRQPKISEYQQKHPQLADDIQDLLSSVAMIEELKRKHDSQPNSLNRRLDEVLQLTRIGDYRIVRELGRGGMGIVFEAVHESLGRRVAIKVLPARSFDDEQSVERFRREAQAAANLHHTNIVSVFGVGQDQGCHYYVMEFVEGNSLKEIVRALREAAGVVAPTTSSVDKTDVPKSTLLEGSADQPILRVEFGERQIRHAADCEPPKPGRRGNSPQIPGKPQRFQWAARMALQIADALAYAHEQGILHRDLKPANLLLDNHDTVWLTDFGLVKHASNRTMTKSGEILGTPQYMAPEAFEGSYDERSETYCLGLTLYELATLHPAYEDKSHAELIRKVISTSPTPHKKIDKDIPRDLTTIIEQAIAREPARRYQTAAALREDLHAFLQDRPIAARRASPIEQAWRWSHRNPWLAILSLVSLLLLIATAATATTGYLISQSKSKQLAIENNKLEIQTRKTEAALLESLLNESYMEEEKQRAEENVAIIVDAFDKLFNQVLTKGTASQFDLDVDGFREMAGIESTITEEDAELLEMMAGFYERVAEVNSESSELKVESARARRRVANAYHMVGSLDAAIDWYDQAVDAYEELLQQNPQSIEFGRSLAQVHNELATAFRNKRDFVSAETEYENAKAELVSHPRADDSAIKFELAKTLNMLAFVWPMRTTGSKFALNMVKQVNVKRRQATNDAIAILDNLVDREPANPDFLLVRIKCYRNLAEMQLKSGEKEAGAKSLRLAINECERLIDEFPDNPDFKSMLALACLTSDGQPSEDQLQSITRAVEISEALAQSDEANLDYRQLETVGRIQLARVQQRSGEQEAARENAKQAAKLLVDTYRDSAGKPDKTTLTRHFAAITRLLHDLGEERAVIELRRALRPALERERPNFRRQKQGER
jgi:serine/threonine protein kinase